jgi:Uncharacterized protein conserved in bacteria (DUF2188)
MKSSTTRKKKKNETPRVVTREEMNALCLHVVLRHSGWVLRDGNHDIKSIHRTQAEAIKKGRVMARKRSGFLAIYDRKGHVRKWEGWSPGPIKVKQKLSPPPFRPSAPRKLMHEAMKAIVRERLAREAQRAKSAD